MIKLRAEWMQAILGCEPTFPDFPIKGILKPSLSSRDYNSIMPSLLFFPLSKPSHITSTFLPIHGQFIIVVTFIHIIDNITCSVCIMLFVLTLSGMTIGCWTVHFCTILRENYLAHSQSSFLAFVYIGLRPCGLFLIHFGMTIVVLLVQLMNKQSCW